MLLGNKRGLMVHLPAGNGAHPRSIHRSKWFGASQQGRKFLESVAPLLPDGRMLSRQLQVHFAFDGITADRIYDVGTPIHERLFVPDHLPALLWSQMGEIELSVCPYIDMRFQRGGSPGSAYQAELEGDFLVVSRTLDLRAGATAEGIDTGGQPATLNETLWVACGVEEAELWLVEEHLHRWKPMWYSLDAARRRYLRRLAVQPSDIVEHAPGWEMASAWVYSPARIQTRDGSNIAFGFGFSKEEAVNAAWTTLRYKDDLEHQKRDRQSALLRNAWFSTGHGPTDRAYNHILSRMMDTLVVEAAAESLTSEAASLLAGNAYFQESWKRDENIALGGLLASGQFEPARSIIDATWIHQDPATGRLPLRYRAGEVPGYTSSDGTLWALVRLAQYVQVTGDTEMLRSKEPMVAHFFDRSLPNCREGLLPSGSVAVPGHEWETWMDTEFSARPGYPAEIQFLWLAALLAFADHVEPGLGLAMRATAEQTRTSLDLFIRGEYFVDHLTRDLEQDDLLTPNGYFWTILGLRFPWEWEEQTLSLGRWELGGVSGVRTLARSQWERVLGPQIAALARSDRPLPSAGKINYHRGVEWNWLSQLFVEGQLLHGNPDTAFDQFIARQIYDATTAAGLGGVSEVFDHRGPAGPAFQTWSMSGLLESLHRFLGVTTDVPNRMITICPQKPRRWPYIKARKWFAGQPFQVQYSGSRTDQRLSVAFEEGVPEDVQLRVELPLLHERVPRRVNLRSAAGVQSIRNLMQLEPRPFRARIEMSAQQHQQFELVA